MDFRNLPNLNELKALKNSFALNEKECEKICKACENALARCDKIALQNGIKAREIKRFSEILKLKFKGKFKGFCALFVVKHCERGY